MKLELPSFAKINLSLNVLGKRGDGYHEVFTVLQTVSLADSLVFEESDKTTLYCDSPSIPTDDRNIIMRAIHELREQTGCDLGVEILLTKRIPSPGGLGGGSSNCAVALLALNHIWNLGLTEEQLVKLGAKLGSDIPFFFVGGTVIGTGRGEQVESIKNVDFPNLLIVSPGVEIPTSKAYSELGTTHLTKNGVESILKHYRQGVEGLYNGRFGFQNDFSDFVFGKHPIIEKSSEILLETGAKIVSLSGSGPSLFAVFETEPEIRVAIEKLRSEGVKRCFPASTISRETYWEQLQIE